MADKRIADFPTLQQAQDTDLILVSSENETYNISFATLKEGTHGDPGTGIESYTEYYAVNNSTTPPADSAFSTTVVNPTQSNRYLWGYTEIQYTDLTELITDKHILGVYGERGDTGYYVTEITNYYLRSANKTGVTRSTSGWSTTVPELTETYPYMWSYTRFTMNSGSYQYSTPCVVGSLGNKGAKGDPGTTGQPGKGITSYTDYYARSTSGTTAPADADFSTTPPELTSTYKYMWSYTVIGYSDNTSSVTTKHTVGVYGDKGEPGDVTVESESGPASIVSVDNAAPLDALNVTVAIEPVQAGSGDPSPTNVRPISGWTGAQVSHSGADTSNPDVISIAFPAAAGTVYGGTLDVTNGVLTVDRAMVDLGTLNWNSSGESYNHRFSATMPSDYKMPPTAADRASFICSAYASNPDVVSNTNELGASGYQNTSGLYIRDLAYSDAATFKTAMSGVQLVYQLATPVEYTVTPHDIALLRGTNNVWADCGDTSLRYFMLGVEDIISKIDAAGIPAGGTTGQVLKKASATDYDTEWGNATGGVWGSITGTLSTQTDLQTALNEKANTSAIPTKVSDLTNDAGYITATTYSTSEVATGDTWVDGKPIYRYVLSNVSITTGASVTIGTLPSLPDVVINIHGSLRMSSGTIRPLSYCPDYGAAYTAWYTIDYTTGEIKSIFGSNSQGATVVYNMIIEYTKAT